MTLWFAPRLDILPLAQQEIWPQLKPAPELGFVLYGGTAVALHLGHRVSVDFDFFSSRDLNKSALAAFPFVSKARTIQEDVNTFVVEAALPSGAVKVSFFGGIDFGRINDPLRTKDSVLLVASQEDLLATKLKAILDRRTIATSLPCSRRGYRYPAPLVRFRRCIARTRDCLCVRSAFSKTATCHP